MITREQLVKIARDAVSGRSRVLEDGSVQHKLPAVECPDKFEPNEWVIEAMRIAYQRGYHAGYADANNPPGDGGGLYPEGG